MRNINKLASLLDRAGNFILADKLDKIAQVQNNDVLETNDPSTFVTSLFNFARNRNINNLSQAFNSYSQSGAKYQGSPISSNKDTVRLYKYVMQNPRMLYPSQLVAVLQTETTSTENFQNTKDNLSSRPQTDAVFPNKDGTYPAGNDVNDEAVPTNYNYYYNYLADQGLDRIAPVGTNNDSQRREKGYLNNQNTYYQEYINNIRNGQDISAAIDEIKNDSNLTEATRQKLLSTSMFLPYLQNK